MVTALTPSTSGVVIRGATPNLELKKLLVELPESVDAGDTFAIDLASYGGTTFVGHQCMVQTTNNSVIDAEANTTAVSGTTLTVTIVAGSDDDKRTLILYYY